MAIVPFLAMTAGEMRNISVLPPKAAWMACHFSPYGLGLSNLPQSLPPGSVLMVDDMTPPRGHDPDRIAQQLTDCAETLQCCGILLDFQRAGSEETMYIASHLAKALPCPVAVSERYAQELDCPVFLPLLPPSASLQSHISPWNGREIWLEIGLDGEVLTLTEESCRITSLPCPEQNAEGFSDETLHCHYTVQIKENAADFTLWRTRQDLEALLEDAERQGITTAIGLYQQLR